MSTAHIPCVNLILIRPQRHRVRAGIVFAEFNRYRHSVMNSLYGFVTASIALMTLTLAVWLGWAWLRGEISPSLRLATALTAGFIAIGALLGLGQHVLIGQLADRWLSMLYGLFAGVCLPGAWRYTRLLPERPRALVLAVACGLAALLLERARQTAIIQ